MSTRARKRYVIAYDVAHNGKRTKLANLLLDYGTRVQKSVFEADLGAADLQEILRKAVNLLEVSDTLRFYPLCKECAEGVLCFGLQVETTAPSLRIV